MLAECSGADAAAIRGAIKRAVVNERKRQSRARLDNGIRIQRVPVRGEVLVGLVEAGFLAPKEENDNVIAIAVAAFLLAHAGGRGHT
jgi:hypothetical protein